MERVTIAQLDIDVDAAVNESARLRNEIERLKTAQKELAAQGSEGDRQFVQNAAALKNLNTAYRQNQEVVSALISVGRDLNKIRNFEGKSITQVRNERTRLIKIVNSLNGETEEEIELAEQLNDTIDDQTKFIRENSSEFNASKDGIGEYQQAIERAIPSNTFLGRAIATLTEALNVVRPLYKAFSSQISEGVSGILNAGKGLEGLNRAQKAAAITSNILTGALKLFRVALISTGIGAIVVALGSLIAFLTGTTEGVNKLNKFLQPLKVIFREIGAFAERLGEILVAAFERPGDAARAVLNFLKEQFLNRIRAIGNIIRKVFTFDFEGIGDDLLQAVTGVEDLTQKIQDAAEATAEFLKEAFERGKRIAELQDQIARRTNDFIVQSAALDTQIKLNNQIAEDTTRSLKDREDAARRTIALEQQKLNLQSEILKRQIEEFKLTNTQNGKLKLNTEEQAELNELIAQQYRAQTAALELQTTQQNKLNAIRKEVADAARREAEARAANARQEALDAAEAAKLEIEIFKETNAEKLAADGELNAARIKAALDAEAFILAESLKIIDDKVAAGLISEREGYLQRLKLENDFNERRAELNAEFQQQQDEIAAERREAEEERKALEAEAELEAEILKAANEFERRQLQLDARRQQEVANAEAIGADTTAIKEKYDLLQQQLDNDVQLNRVEGLQKSFSEFGQLASTFFGENKRLSKALALADTFLSAQKAYLSQLIPGDPTSVGRAIAAAAKATLFGLANVAKIGQSRFARGGILDGPSHANGGIATPFGEMEGGEAVINKKSTRKYRGLLSAINAAGGGIRFQSGGITGEANRLTFLNNIGSRLGAVPSTDTDAIDYDRLTLSFAEAASNISPMVSVEEIQTVATRVAVVEDGANV